MLFSKPNIKYTDMCIWIDDLIQRGNPTEEELNKAYEYVYHLGFMLAHKHKYFNKSFYYEEFAIFLATEVMYRLFLNPRLSQVDENGNPCLEKIRSVLNYLKSIIYCRKIEFEQLYYSQKFIKQPNVGDYIYSYNEDLYNSVKELDITLYLTQISKTIKHIVYKNNFYKNDKLLMKNIYLSCLLTVLNGLTLSDIDIEKLQSTYSSIDSKYKLLSRLYAKNRKNSLILYHLDDSYKDYIVVLSNKIFKALKEDLTEMSHQSFYLSNDAITDMLYLELNGDDYE